MMAGFWLTNKRITDLNIRHIYGGSEAPGDNRLLKNTRTFSLRNKEKEKQRAEALQRRIDKRLFDANSRGEYVVPRAPAFRELEVEEIDEIVNRLNHPKSAPRLRRSQSAKSPSGTGEPIQQRPRPLSERELSDVSLRLHSHQTHMSRMRSGKGVRLPPPLSRVCVKSAR